MKWITRANANVDRVACPWLIKRFIDPTPSSCSCRPGRSWQQPSGSRRFLEKIRLESPMYDALYACCQSRVASSR